jgi:LysM repeat protein
MHPDKRVGLSLGILLIGVTAAFFFRNDVPVDQVQALELTDPESLDEQIRRKAQTPYLPDRPEATVQTEAPVVRDALVADVMPQPSGMADSVPGSTIPDPIRPRSEAPAGRIAPIPHPSGDPDGIDQALAQADARRKQNSESSETRTAPVIHVVMPKDTLSGLAQKYLGSFRRYREIFETNRDQLDSPDDIREGMKLRIPTGKSPVTTQRDAAESVTTAERPVETPEPARDSSSEDVEPPRPTFVRPPGNRRLPGRRTSQKSDRSLSQEPPPGLPVVDSFDPDKSRARIASRPPEVTGRDSSKTADEETE